MRRVVKVGGSLLGREDLTIALPRWLERQAECETLMLTGGGGLVDAIRDLDAIRPGDPVRTHWICVELLDVTFRLMSNWFDWPTVNTSAQLQQGLIEGFGIDRPTLVAVDAFYSREQDSGQHAGPAAELANHHGRDRRSLGVAGQCRRIGDSQIL